MAQQLKTSGRFKARIVAHGVTETKNGFPQWVAKFACYEQEGVQTDAAGNQLRDGSGRPQMGWIPLDDEYEITEFMILGYNGDNGQEFTNTFNSLLEALHWQPNPADVFGSLQAHDCTQVVVQLVVDEETYDGKTRPRVQFINPENFEGIGVKQLDAAGLAKLNNTWAATFRAKFGAGGGAAPAPAPMQQQASAPAAAAPVAAAPAPQASAPAAPAPQAAAPAPVGGQAPAPAPAKPETQAPPAAATGSSTPPPATDTSPGCTMDEAWAGFAARKGQMSDDKLGAEWFRFLKDTFGASSDDEIAKVTPAQWAWMRDHADPIPF